MAIKLLEKVVSQVSLLLNTQGSGKTSGNEAYIPSPEYKRNDSWCSGERHRLDYQLSLIVNECSRGGVQA